MPERLQQGKWHSFMSVCAPIRDLFTKRPPEGGTQNAGSYKPVRTGWLYRLGFLDGARVFGLV